MKKLKQGLLAGAMLACAGSASAGIIEFSENFDNGQLNSGGFVTTGLHAFSGGELYTYNRDMFRTADQYFATQSAPVEFDFTMTFMGGNMSFLAMRVSEDPYDPNHEPAAGLILRMHNFQDGHTGIGENYQQNYEFHNPQSGDAFYGYGQPIEISMTDYGTYVDIAMRNTVTNEENVFSYTSDFFDGGYYGFSTSGGVKIDNVSLRISDDSELSVDVPEPASVGLLGAVLLAMRLRRRK